MSHLDERNLYDIGFNRQNVEKLRELDEGTVGSGTTIINLDDLQKIILQLNDKSAAVSELESRINQLETQLKLLKRPNDLSTVVKNLEMKQFTKPVNDHERRLSDLEKRVM